jgi:hypothetical protein
VIEGNTQPGPPRPLVGRIAAALGSRVLRVRIDRIPRSLAVAVAALWAAWAGIAVALLLPGAIAPLGADPFGQSTLERGAGHDPGFLTVWCVLIGTSAVVGSAAVLLLLLRPRRGAARAGPAVLAFAISCVPLLFLLSAGAVAPAGLTLLPALAATALAAVAASVGPDRRRDVLAVLTGLALAIVWAPLLVDGLTSAVPLSLVSSYVVLGSGAVAVTGFVTLGGVASAAESANATAGSVAGTLARRSTGTLGTAIVLAAVLLVLALRFTVLNDVFGELEAGLWSLRTPSSWPHAVLIGALVVLFALGSARRPYASRGQRLVTTLITLAAGLSNLVLVGAAVLLFVLLAVTGEVTDPSPYLGYIHLAGLAVVLVLLVPALRPSLARTTGRVGAVVGLVYLVPMLVSLVFSLASTDIPPFWASPTQVVVVVALAAAGLFVAGLVRRRPLVEPAMLVRLAVIPVVAVHAGELLPAVWSDALDRGVVVALSLLAFLLLSPRPVTDARRTARSLVAASALQVAILGTFATSIVLDYDAEVFTVVAVIWLAVPVSAVLCCRAVPSAPRDHDLADHAPRLHQAVGLAQRGGIDGGEGAGEGALQGA